MSLLLEGKRAFVSGGTRGIGAAICEVFAREGADVAFNYHSRDDLAAVTVAVAGLPAAANRTFSAINGDAAADLRWQETLLAMPNR